MKKYLIAVLLLLGCSCNRAKHGTTTNSKDSIEASLSKPKDQYALIKENLFNSDSVILFSHYSPNEPIKIPGTDKYYSKSIPFILNGKINYKESVQERKLLSKKEIQELVDILTSPAIDDSIRTMCFQPRNAVVVFKNGLLSCVDFCFECHGFSIYNNFDTGLVMNNGKYKMLYDFYKKKGFKYEMD